MQARTLPPPELMKSILERDAERYAKCATLGKNGDKWTPFAAKTFEDQREKSKGYVVHSLYAMAPSFLSVFFTRNIDVEDSSRQRWSVSMERQGEKTESRTHRLKLKVFHGECGKICRVWACCVICPLDCLLPS